MHKETRGKTLYAGKVQSSISEKLQQGVEVHQGGDYQRAEAVYKEVLAKSPNNVDALHLLGLVLIHTKRPEGGVELIDRALAIRPNDAEAHNNRGAALMALKRFDEALASFEAALSLRPGFVALSNRGNALQELKRLDEALVSYDQALTI